VEALVGHRQTLLELELPSGADDFVFASERATRLSDDNVRARVLRPAVAQANERRGQAGLPPLPGQLTPIRCAAPTSRSRCWPPAAMSSG